MRDERTLSKKCISDIYNNGLSEKTFHLKGIWKKSKIQSPKIRLLIAVPKKNIKKAVDRNYIKRIIRESYKINKACICNLILYPIDIILIYNKTTLTEFNELKIELLTLFEMIYKNQNENIQ